MSAELAKLAVGRTAGSPFAAGMVEALRQRIVQLVEREGASPSPGPDDLDCTPANFRLLGAVLKQLGDPDGTGIADFARGVRVGVGVRLPRLPALYPPKRKWRLEEQRGLGHGGSSWRNCGPRVK